MKKSLISAFLLVLLLPSLALSQGYLKRFIGKDSSTVANCTKMDQRRNFILFFTGLVIASLSVKFGLFNLTRKVL